MAPRKKIQFSDLPGDVIFEIFLAFVAVDWDGPFTLTLVSAKWRNIVLSHPRLWAWIMVDDTQADWKERIDISAYLSKKVPLQICLRIPFTSTIPMKFITCRCTTLIVESDSWHPSDWAKMWPNVFGDATFPGKLSDAERDALSLFLKDAPKDQIKVLHSDGHPPYSYYSMWAIYDDYMAGNSSIHLTEFQYSVTALVFNTERDERTAIPLQLSQLWEILPSLSRLGYLEVSDNIINSDKPVALPPLLLPCLQSIVLLSPMSRRGVYALEGDIWLGLFSLLDYLAAPGIEHMLLRGSAYGILAVMVRATMSIRPSDFVIETSSFNRVVLEHILEPNPAWHKLARLTIGLPASENALLRVSVDESIATVRSLMFLVPRTCSIRVYTDKVEMAPLGLQHILEDEMPHGNTHLSRLRSLATAIAHSCGSILFQTTRFTECVVVEGQQLVTKSLGLYADWWHNPSKQQTINGPVHLVDFRCSPSQLINVNIARGVLKSLRALTLFDDGWGGVDGFVKLVPILVGCADSLPHLITLSIETVYAWKPLIELLGNFGKAEGRGISTLNLPYLPHPSILREIILALNNRYSGYSTRYLERVWKEHEIGDAPGCWECFKSGWTCFGSVHGCTSSSKNRVASITKDSTWRGIDAQR